MPFMKQDELIQSLLDKMHAMFDAASNIAADTAYQLYTDQRVIRCVRVLMNQKVK